VNARGAERAIATARCRQLGFPYSILATISLSGITQQTPEDVRSTHWRPWARLAYKAGLDVTAYISMPYAQYHTGDAWSVESGRQTQCELLIDTRRCAPDFAGGYGS